MDIDAVVDSSVIVALVTLEKHTEWASKTVQEFQYLHVLDLSFYEVANALDYKVSGNFEKKDARAAFKQAERIMNLSSVHEFFEVVAEALDKALELNISVYDAAFLSLADKLGSRLLTLDAKLAKKLENTRYARLAISPNLGRS